MTKIVFAEPIGLTDQEKVLFTSQMESQGCSVTYFDDIPKTDNELAERIGDAQILVVSNLPVSAGVIERAPALEHIAVAFTGVDHIAREACKAKGINISNAAGYSTQAVAELTMGMAIDLFRNMTPADTVTRMLGSREGYLGRELSGKTFGIIGMGAIGQRVAQLANAFGCNVISWTRTKKDIDYVKFTEFDDAIKSADILSLHLPLTPETENLIGIREFKMMKPSSILINTARAKIVNERALIDALYQKLIAGAALDIYQYEPPLKKDYPLLKANNTLMLPHIGFATHEAIALRSRIIFENIKGWLNGKPQNIVD
ncbi:MAG TPA: NAD(P)-dependent oxidoreductase [Perlabentimonas sp.]|nr:NAD(P)-dependent oxidoreductase [Perlabentimonas sp.]